MWKPQPDNIDETLTNKNNSIGSNVICFRYNMTRIKSSKLLVDSKCFPVPLLRKETKRQCANVLFIKSIVSDGGHCLKETRALLKKHWLTFRLLCLLNWGIKSYGYSPFKFSRWKIVCNIFLGPPNESM